MKDKETGIENLDYIKKSNFLIGAKYKSSLLENKILAIALANIQNVTEEHGLLYSCIKASELRKLLNANSGSFYNQLDQAASALTGRTIGMNDPSKKVFKYVSVVIHSSYENGVLTIKYNPEVKDYIQDIVKNYTKFKLSILLSFNTSYSYRLYELLKSKAYYSKNGNGQENNGIFHVSFLLSELKFVLGVIDADQASVKKILDNEKKPDYDKAYDKAKSKVFESWGDFKKKVLEVAKKEINEKSDITIDYTPVRGGRGGKIFQVDFTISLDENIAEFSDIPEDDKTVFLDRLTSLLCKDDQKLNSKDIASIAAASEYDWDKIMKAYSCMKQQNGTVNNIVGWMITALKKDFHAPPNGFNRCMDGEYAGKTEDELEKMLGIL